MADSGCKRLHVLNKPNDDYWNLFDKVELLAGEGYTDQDIAHELKITVPKVEELTAHRIDSRN